MEDQLLHSLAPDREIVTGALERKDTDIVILGVEDIEIENIEARNKKKEKDKQNEEMNEYEIEGRCNLNLSFR